MVMRKIAPMRRSPRTGGSMQVRRKRQTPYYEFLPRLRFSNRSQAEQFSGFVTEMQGDTPFWFDGCTFGDIQNPIQIGVGDGTRTQFYIPYRNLFANSWVILINAAINSVWTMNEVTGLLTFGAAPAANAQISGYGRGKFKCLLKYDDVLQEQAESFKLLWDEGEIVFEEMSQE